jgi:DNA-directed RNA polymerase subunit RPC12/RpoP
MSDTKPCKTCGAEFKKSRADRTVNCPACRADARAPKVEPHVPTPMCGCGKTVFLKACSNGICPRCGDKAVWA